MQNENQQSTGLGLLSSLANRIKVENIWFNNQIVTLDGYIFSHCRFDGCELNIWSINFELHRCFIDENTEIIYNGEIIKIVKLFNRRSERIFRTRPMFAPSRHDDGTISITF